MKWLADFCRETVSGFKGENYFYAFGFTVGYLAAREMSFEDLCSICEGCEKPICMPGGMK